MKKKMNRISIILTAAIMASLIVGTQFVPLVGAKKPTITDYGDYTFTVGKLDGADYGLYIPDEWNGMLVILCRGYRHELPGTFPGAQSLGIMIGRWFMGDPPHPMPPLPPGPKFAFAWSNYGEGGYCIKAGMKRTHQLTEYIIDNYEVSGKVFLFGISMGGAVACGLGEKYPNLYSGVLDMVGTKDLAASHAHKAALASQTTLEGIQQYFETFTPTPIPYSAYETEITPTNYMDYIDGQGVTQADIELECGGSPAEKPKAYERRSPVDNPIISIPVIIVHGTYDRSVPYTQSVEYSEMVNAVTEPDLCRLYLIP